MCKLFLIFVQIYKMQRLIGIFILLFFISSSCKQGKPSGILNEDTMVELLGQVHVLDGYLTTLPIDSAKKVMDPLYNEVFAKFGLDSTSFDKNINYYYGNPKLSAVVYDKIVKNLENEEKAFVREDSLKNVHYMDSVRLVNFANKRLEIWTRMTLDPLMDSLEYPISEPTRRMYEASGMDNLWRTNFYKEWTPTPASPITGPAVQPQPLTPAPELQKPVGEGPKELELKPIEPEESVIHTPLPKRSEDDGKLKVVRPRGSKPRSVQ